MKAAVIGSLDIECMGGGEANTIMFANLMSELGYEVTYFGSGCTGDGGHGEFLVANVRFNYFPSAYRHDFMANPYIIKTSRLLSMGLIGMFNYKKTRRMLDGFDLYYFANPTLLARRLIPEIQSRGKRVILANHGTFFEYLGNSGNIALRMCSKILTKFLLEPLNSMDNVKIHTQNSTQTEYYKKLGFANNIIVEIPQHNVNFDNYKISPKRDGFSVAFLGRLTESKGIDILIELAKMNPEIEFHVMGRGPMRGALKNNDVNHNVVLHGFVTDEEKRHILASCDAMVIPSVFESLSIASIEGLASGLPLVASETAQGLRYILSKDSTFGNLVPRNSISFSLEIQRLKKRKEEMYEKYVNERELRKESVKNIFDQKKLLSKLVKIVHDNDEPEKYAEFQIISVIG